MEPRRTFIQYPRPTYKIPDGGSNVHHIHTAPINKNRKQKKIEEEKKYAIETNAIQDTAK